MKTQLLAQPITVIILLFSLLFFGSANAQCPGYSNTVQASGEACGGQNYSMSVENTSCNGDIYITIQTNYDNGLGFNWVLESVLTGNTIASGTNGNATVPIGPVNPNIEGGTFNLILNDPYGFGFLSYEYIEARQGASVLAHLNDPGHSMFVALVTISPVTMTVTNTTSGGSYSNTITHCKDIVMQVPLSNTDYCVSKDVDLDWEIQCDQTNAVLASGTHKVTVHPDVPTSAADLVDISWNAANCEWDVIPQNDCQLSDLDDVFSIHPNPLGLRECESGTREFEITYNGTPNSPNCWETGGPDVNIKYNGNFSTTDFTAALSPFSDPTWTNCAAYLNIPPNIIGGNATNFNLCINTDSYCYNSFSTDIYWITVFIDDIIVKDEQLNGSGNYNTCINLSDIPGGYSASSNIEIFVYSNTINPSTFIPSGCGNISTNEWSADISVNFNIEFEDYIGSPISNVFNESMSFNASCYNGAEAPTNSTGGGEYCEDEPFTLEQWGGVDTPNSVDVWYAAVGEDSYDPDDCDNEGFIELWSDFKYEKGISGCYHYNRNTDYDINGGVVELEVQNDEDPFIWMYPLPGNQTIDANVYKYVNVRYRVKNLVGSAAPKMGVLWTKRTIGCNLSSYPNGDYPFSSTGQPSHMPGHKKVDIINDNNWHIISIPVHEEPAWTSGNGIITGLRFDYLDPFPHDGHNGSEMEVDFLIVSKHPMIGEGKDLTLNPGDEWYPETGTSTTYYAKKIDDCGVTDCVAETVTINALPEANDASLTVCEDVLGSGEGTFDLTDAEGDINTESGTITFTYFDSGNSQITNPTNYVGENNEQITVVVDNGKCTDEAILTLHTKPLPTVSINPISDMCIDAPVVTVSGSPAASTFSGPGISGNTFSPSVAGVGVHTITISFTAFNGCENTATTTVEVFALPAVTISSINDLCVDASAVPLTGNPTGGTFSGPGVSGSSFNPVAAGVGNHTITYTYTDGNSCTNTATTTVEVFALPTVTISSINDLCVDASAVPLTGNPTGGTFSGTGVTGSSFNPTTAGVGNHTITYTYTDGNSCTNTATTTVEVFDLPTLTISSINDLCVDASAVPLTGNPTGGTFSGIGVTGSSFNPTTAGVGNHTITYTYTDGNSCTNTATTTVEVFDLPVVSINPIADLCSDDAAVTLVGSPTGGTFSGTGVNNGEFDPSVAGVGSHVITYEYTDGNTCENSTTITIEVKEVPTYSLAYTDPTTCGGDEGTITVSGLTPNETYDVTFNGSTTTITTDASGEYTFTGLEAGNYSGFEVSLDGCPKSDAASFDLEDPNAPTVTVVSDFAICAGDEITLIATNPDGANISWDNGVTDGQPFTPTATATYTATAELNGCTSSASVTVTVNPLPTPTIDAVADLCNDDAAVPLVGNPVGGTFSGTGVSGNDFDPSVAGVGSHVITYEYTDGNTCENSTTITIEVKEVPVYTLAYTDPTTCGGDEGTITVSGLTPNTTYDITYNGSTATVTTDGSGEYTFTGLEAGNYSGFEVSLDGCPKSDAASFDLEDPNAPTVTVVSDFAICAGDEITLIATNPDGANISWDNGVTDGQPFTPTATATYTATAELNGCTSSASVTVTVNPLPIVSIDAVADLCNDDAAVPLVGNPVGGTFSGTGVSGNDFDPSVAGVGSHVITYEYEDGNTCENSTTITIEVKEVPTYSLAYTDPTTCGGNEGTITVSGLTPNETYDVTFNGNTTTITTDASGEYTFSGLEAGNYSGFEVSSDGCPKSDASSFDLEDPNAPTVTVVSDFAICAGDEITLTATNPDGANISWDNGVTDGQPFTPTTTETYTATAELNGCTSSASVTVTVNPLPIVSIDPIADLCNDDAAVPLVGNPIGGTFSGNGVSGNDFDPSVAGVGSHVITYEYTDGNSCENSTTITIEVKEVPVYTLAYTDPTTCGGDEGTITVSGLTPNETYDVTFNGNTTTITTDASGEYTFTGLEAGTYSGFEVSLDGCPKSDASSFDLEDPNAPTVTVVSDFAICAGEEITLTATNPDGANISWDNGVTDGQPFTPTATTIYTATAELHGCTSSASVTVTVNPLPIVSIDAVADLCNDDAAVPLVGDPIGGTFSGTGVNNGDFDPSVAGVGSHVITYEYEDGNGCENSTTTTIEVKEVPVYTLAYTDPTTCGGDEGTITVSGLTPSETYDVTFNGNTTTITTDASGEYTFTGLEAGNYSGFEVSLDGCPKSDAASFDLEDPNAPNVDAGADVVVCDGEEVTLTATVAAGVNVSWDNGITDGQPFTPALGTTVYTVTAELDNCFSTDVVEVLVNPLPTPTIDAVADLCNDDAAVTLVGNPVGGTFSGTGVSGNDFDPSVAGVGSHIITYEYEDGNTCENSTTITIEVKEVPVYTLSYTDPTTCGGDEGTITLSGLNAGDDYEVSYNGGTSVTMTADTDGDIVITGLEQGSYTDFEVSLDGCPAYDSSVLDLEDPDAPAVDAGADVVVCDGEEVTLTATVAAGVNVSWDNGITDGQPFTPALGTTVYTVTAELANCFSTDIVEVTVNPLPLATIGGSIDVCESDDSPVIVFTGSNSTAPYTFTYEDASGNEQTVTSDSNGEAIITVDTDVPGTYTYTLISVEDASSTTCSNAQTGTVTITVKPLPVFEVSVVDDEVCIGSSISLKADDVEDGVYYWDGPNGFTSSAQNPTISDAVSADEGEYFLVVDKDGCTVEKSVYVTIKACEIYVGEVVTPNGDGYNDTWIIENLEGFPGTEVWIYNRWGMEVYHNENYQNEWDGFSFAKTTLGNERLPEGSYYYVVKLGGDGPNKGDVYKGYLYLKTE